LSLNLACSTTRPFFVSKRATMYWSANVANHRSADGLSSRARHFEPHTESNT
jgi:hypothetical protein